MKQQYATHQNQQCVRFTSQEKTQLAVNIGANFRYTFAFSREKKLNQIPVYIFTTNSRLVWIVVNVWVILVLDQCYYTKLTSKIY